MATTALGSHRVVVARPQGNEPGVLSIDMLSAFARARDQRADAFFLFPTALASEALFALEPSAIKRLDPHQAGRTWLAGRWWLARMGALMRSSRIDAAASFWLEMHRELRRYVGDERLPYPLRTQLRRVADWMSRNAGVAERRQVVPRFSRTALRDSMPMMLPPPVSDRARKQVIGLGIDPDARIVAFDGCIQSHLLKDAVALVVAGGYRVVRLGCASSLSRDGRVVDVPMDAGHDALRAYLLLKSAFVVCGSPALQRTCWLTNTPSLLLNARDPFTAYPVRRDGIFTLATVIDLDTGRPLAIAEQLEPSFFQNLRNCGFRHHGPTVVIAALSEMMDGLRDGWPDTAAQARFRARAAAAGAAIGGDIPRLAEHDVASGFIGDGRLAAVQADCV